MAKCLRIIVVFAFALSAAKVVPAQDRGLGADDTVAYINATLHKYPTLEFVESGCAGFEQVVAISEDRRSLVIRQNFGKSDDGKCQDVQTLTAPVFNISKDDLGAWSKQGQHTSLFLDCTNRIDCFARRSEGNTFASAENNWHLQLTGPDEVSHQLRLAIRRLVAALLVEASSRVDNKDAFAKPGR